MYVINANSANIKPPSEDMKIVILEGIEDNVYVRGRIMQMAFEAHTNMQYGLDFKSCPDKRISTFLVFCFF